jgi:hypothetical protein
MNKNIPERFIPAIQQIKNLQRNSRYFGAFVFGSIVRGETTSQSDLDVKVVIDKDSCKNINHPFINGVKLDVSFYSFKQLGELLEHQTEKNERPPMIAESIILFDTTGKLKELQKKYQAIKPKKYSDKEYQLVQFLTFFANQKVEDNLKTNPTEALFSMYVNVNDLLKTHYKIHGRWWVSDKNLFKDLALWDATLLKIVEDFVIENEVNKKFALWSQMIDYILEPLGGRQKIEDNNCNCKDCQTDLANLLSGSVNFV